MAEETTTECCDGKYNYKYKHWHKGGGNGAVYCLGFIGALIYFIQHANTFGAGLLGILKAIVWPAMLVYHLFGFLGL